MGEYFGYHFGVFNCYWQVLLFYGLPVHPGELVNLIYQLLNYENVS